jgi:Asp-tRNA(Asn)/Glu-tRNA(Gln) amidotransferase A subunit family amidase
MNPDDIGFLGVRDLTAAYRARKLSPVEVVQAILARIERVENCGASTWWW